MRLETTSNQAFLATSSMARHLVAASELLHRSTTEWVNGVIDDLPAESVTVLTAVSGVAILLVDSHATGRAIVRSVTRRALDEAPGMIVHGAVVELASRDGAGLANALRRSAGRLVENRARTADGVRADLMLPLVAPCRMTGRPAAGLLMTADSEGGRVNPVSSFVLRVEQDGLRDAAFRRMVAITGDGEVGAQRGRRSGMRDLMQRIDDRARVDDAARWMAVVHADGNGIGAVFLSLSEELRGIADMDAAVRRFRAVSEAVDRAAQEALRAAVAVVTRGRDDDPPAVLPLVCAGDDLTMLVEADIALELTVAYAREFAQRTAEDADIPSDGLTVGAGIAVTKPGHPILFGLELSEALASRAKTAGRRARAEDRTIPATVDLHVLHGSGGLGIDDVRPAVAGSGDALPPTAGPWSIDGDVDDLDAVKDLQNLVVELADPDSPARALGQRLRVAAEVGRAAFDDVVRRSLVRSGGAVDGQPSGGSGLDAFAGAGCAIHEFGDDATADRHRARVVDALALVGVLTPAQRRTIVAAGRAEVGR